MMNTISRGLSWGGFQFRFEYDYDPVVRPLEKSVAGQRMIARIERDRDVILETMRAAAALKDRFAAIPTEAINESEPFWANGWLPAGDAIILYSLVATQHPKQYIEVGSGNSTKFVRRAIRDLGLKTRIVSIDPSPRAEVDQLCDEVIRQPVEQVDIGALVDRVEEGDVLFIDNSHRSFQNSDTTVCLVELLPAAPSGAFVGIHDICLPFDYHSVYKDYFYNEQYLLAMYLLGGAQADTVVMPTWYAARAQHFASALGGVLDVPSIPPDARGGSSFWLRRGSAVLSLP